MTASVIQLLRCPVCGASVESDREGKVLSCSGIRRHCFDFAKSGYLNLCRSAQAGGGDSKEAVRSRSSFLSSGYYQPLADAVCKLLKELHAQTVIDAGCGEGYYTNQMATGRTVIGADLSRPAIDHAAKTAKAMQNQAGFVVASVFELPMKDASVDAVTGLFAPCAEQECLRVLKPNGHLILVGAGELHLMGLKRLLYDDPHRNLGRADLPKEMELVHKERLQYSALIQGNAAVQDLFSMTPYYWRTSESDRAKLSDVAHLETELDFDIFLYKKGN